MDGLGSPEGVPLVRNDGGDDFASGLSAYRPGWSMVVRVSVIVGVLVAALVLFAVLLTVVGVARPKSTGQKVLIIMIGDGMGPAAVTLARVRKNQGLLAWEPYLLSSVRTHSNSSWVTDSAAAATAYSCGEKTFNGGIGVTPDLKACGTMLEAAMIKGWRTGLVVTCRMTHATPAAFSSHVQGRNDEFLIASQQVVEGVDVMLGGGLDWFQGSTRPDHVDLWGQAAANYTLLQNVSDLARVRAQLAHMSSAQRKRTRLFGLFAPDHIPYVLDQSYTNTTAQYPTLAENTQVALDLLEGSSFVLMVEGSRIDMAAHANDISSQYGEMLSFESAFSTVLAWAEKRRGKGDHVQILLTADHNTGGESMGSRYLFNTSYPTYAFLPEVLEQVLASTETMASAMQAALPNITAAFEAMAAICDFVPTQEEIDYLTPFLTEIPEVLQVEVGLVVANRALVGYTTPGHTGVDVGLYVAGAEQFQNDFFRGPVENDALGRWMASEFGLDLAAATVLAQQRVPSPPPPTAAASLSEPHDHRHPR